MLKQVRKALFGAVAGVALVAGGAGQAWSETLTDALIMAYKNSNLLEQNRAVLRAADEGVAQAVAELRPVIQFTANHGVADSSVLPGGFRTSTSAELAASITVYDGGSNKMAIESAKEAVLAARADLIAVEQDVLLSAVEAFMNVVSASQSVQLSQNNVRLIREQLRAAQDRFDVGEVTRTDVSIAQSRLAAAQSAMVANEGALAAAREAYKAVIGQYPGVLSGVGRLPSLPKSVDDARAIAVRTHPNIISAQHNVTSSELSVARARAARGPSVSAVASQDWVRNGAETTSFGLRLNQTLYSGGALKSVERQALAGVDASRAGLHQVVRLVEQAVAGNWANLAVARAQLQASEQQIRAAQLAFDGTKEEARLGSRTTLDVLDAEQELLDARTARVQAENSQYVAYYALLGAMGLLTVDHLNLGIPTYDPAAYYNAVKSAPISSVQGERLDEVLKKIGKK